MPQKELEAENYKIHTTEPISRYTLHLGSEFCALATVHAELPASTAVRMHIFSFTCTHILWHMNAHIHRRTCLRHTRTHTRCYCRCRFCSSFPLAEHFSIITSISLLASSNEFCVCKFTVNPETWASLLFFTYRRKHREMTTRWGRHKKQQQVCWGIHGAWEGVCVHTGMCWIHVRRCSGACGRVFTLYNRSHNT